MKAIEYAKRFKDAKDPYDELDKIVMDFIRDSKILIKARNCKSDSGLISIIKELDDKYRTFVKLTGDRSLKPNGFVTLVGKASKIDFESLLNKPTSNG